jgi:hypothetical protein
LVFHGINIYGAKTVIFLKEHMASGIDALTQSRDNNNSAASSLFKYPSDLFTPGAEPFVVFSIYHPVAKNSLRLGSMALYMPPTLKVRYHAEYEELSLDWEKWSAWAKEVVNGNDRTGMIMRGAAGVVQNVTGANTIGSFDLYQGKTVNPHMALLFRGIGFREFTFEFHMMAKNEQETKAIQNIIYQFKYHMHPAMDGGTRYFQYPSNFTVEFFTPTEEYMFKIGTCVLQNMEVDYAGSGVPSFFTDTGAPVDIRLILNFKENLIVTKELIEKGF